MSWRIMHIAKDQVIHQGLEAEVDLDNILCLYNSSHSTWRHS